MNHIPTVAELAHRGLAHPIAWTKDGHPTRYAITPAGHAMLGRLMRENGLEAQIAGDADWTPPPTRQIAGLHPQE